MARENSSPLLFNSMKSAYRHPRSHDQWLAALSITRNYYWNY